MSSSIKKLLKKAKALHKYIKYDGKVTNLTLSQVQYGGILKGKRIVVTGGGSGIGLAMARKFISEGAGVVITGRNREKLEQAGKSICRLCHGMSPTCRSCRQKSKRPKLCWAA